MWRIAAEVIKPRKENEWSLKKDNDSVTSDLQEVADIFNNFFIQKVQDLKANIDKEFVEDSLINLTPKNKEGIKLELKTVTHKQILKCLKKIKKTECRSGWFESRQTCVNNRGLQMPEKEYTWISLHKYLGSRSDLL